METPIEFQQLIMLLPISISAIASIASIYTAYKLRMSIKKLNKEVLDSGVADVDYRDFLKAVNKVEYNLNDNLKSADIFLDVILKSNDKISTSLKKLNIDDRKRLEELILSLDEKSRENFVRRNLLVRASL